MNKQTKPLRQHLTDPRFQGIPSDPLDKVFTTLLMERTTDGVWYDREATPFTDLVQEAKEVIKAHLIELVESVFAKQFEFDNKEGEEDYNSVIQSEIWAERACNKEALIKAIEGESNEEA